MRQNAWKDCVTSGLLSAGLLLGANSVVADPTAIVKLPQDIIFKGSAAGVQIAILYGDPAKPGLYVVRLKLPGGAKVEPHTHPEEVRTLTVLSGTLYFGFGEEWPEPFFRSFRMSLILSRRRTARSFFKRPASGQAR
jgi:hypothetical protein